MNKATCSFGKQMLFPTSGIESPQLNKSASSFGRHMLSRHCVWMIMHAYKTHHAKSCSFCINFSITFNLDLYRVHNMSFRLGKKETLNFLDLLSVTPQRLKKKVLRDIFKIHHVSRHLTIYFPPHNLLKYLSLSLDQSPKPLSTTLISLLPFVNTKTLTHTNLHLSLSLTDHHSIWSPPPSFSDKIHRGT